MDGTAKDSLRSKLKKQVTDFDFEILEFLVENNKRYKVD